jgi:hypothetical protein
MISKLINSSIIGTLIFYKNILLNNRHYFFSLMLMVEEKSNRTHKPRGKRIVIIFGSIILLLLIIRILLPVVGLWLINTKLSALEKYQGHVRDLDICLLNGSFTIEDLWLDDRNKDKGDSLLLFKVSKIKVNFVYSALFKGQFKGSIGLYEPQLNYVPRAIEPIIKDSTKVEQVTEKTQEEERKFHITELIILDANVSYKDTAGKIPGDDLKIKQVWVNVKNISNIESNELLTSVLTSTGQAFSGHFSTNAKFNLNRKPPAFDLNAAFENIDLTLFNALFNKHGNFEVNKGILGVYAEIASKNGTFEGYVKPIIKDLDINTEKGPIQKKLWSYMLEGTSEILENSDEQIAGKIPIQGKFDNPETDLWTALAYVLRNAFVTALRPAIDNSINISDVGKPEQRKSFLKKVLAPAKNENE